MTVFIYVGMILSFDSFSSTVHFAWIINLSVIAQMVF